MSRVSRKNAESKILNRFLIGYQKRFGIVLSNVIHRDKPDFEVTNPVTGKKLGIEITGVYQDPQEAESQYTIHPPGTVSWIQGSLDDLLAANNECLRSKADKSLKYNFGGNMVLAIWIGSSVYNRKFDIDYIKHDITIPESRFSQVWLILKDKEDYSPELYPLYANT